MTEDEGVGHWTIAKVAAGAVVLAGATTAMAAEDELEIVEVIAPLGIPGDGESLANVQQAAAAAVAESRTLDLADFLRRNLASVFINEAQGNPLQADVQFRGFVGSPLLGLPQGIAVYQDAVRINEPFGDTVNWALIPEAAIATVTLVPGSNPLFGLNALGGTVSIRTKDGADHPGSTVELLAGSFGRRALTAQTGGVASENLSYYATASALAEDGWRDFSPTDARQAFAKVVWHRERIRVDASATLVRTDLIGNGTAPIDLLRQQRGAIFTRPDQTENALAQGNVVARLDLAENVAIDANVYFRTSDIDSYNGDDSDFEPCEDEPEWLCEEEDETVFDAQGQPVAAAEALEGATINRTRTEQDGIGFGVQADWLGALGGRTNRLVAGMAFDASAVDFAASTELGTLDPTRLAVPGGVFVNEAFTDVTADTEYLALYLADTLALSDALSITAAARLNSASVTLRDQRGTALDGDHRFRRINPAVGISYRLPIDILLYANYGETNRAPSPVELTCADEDAPCRLPNAFLADPPLAQVVARTLEVGARGVVAGVQWRGGWFQARNADDIIFISAGALTNQGYFANVGTTQRSGFELSLDGGTDERLRWFIRYTVLSATFEDAFPVPSANHPRATGGEIAVQAGDRLPLVPERLLKAGVQLSATPRLDFAANLLHASRRHYRGDEANLASNIEGYAVLNLRADFRVNDRVSMFATMDNAFDEDYATFGLFGEADEVLGDDFEDTRFLTPAAPRAAWAGVEIRF